MCGKMGKCPKICSKNVWKCFLLRLIFKFPLTKFRSILFYYTLPYN
jgi:hypothetical protein